MFRGMQCFLFGSYDKINKIYYQTQQGLKRKISRLVFKLFLGKLFALSKYAPVTLHYFPATAILNETPVFAIGNTIGIIPLLWLPST